MKSVIFKKIKIKNFLSIGNEWVEIDYKTGINVVTGMNYDKDSRNGIGKSALLTDSLAFVLFGNPVRDIKKEFIGNRYSNGSTKIILSFDVVQGGDRDQYILMRSINPTKIQLVKNGTDITKSSIPKTTEFVCKLLGATPEVFSNTVIMTLNNTVPFMAQKKVDKRKFIEGVLNLEVFSNMLLLARQEYNDFKREYDSELTRLDEVSKALKTYQEQQSNVQIGKETRIAELLRRKTNNQNEIVLLRPQISTIATNTVTIEAGISLLKGCEEKVDNEINTSNKLIGTWEADINHIDLHIKDLQERGDICTKCRRVYTDKDKELAEQERVSDEEKKAALKQQIESEKTKLNEARARKEKYQQDILTLRGQIEANNLKVKENENILARIDQLNNWNKQIDKDIAKIENEIDHFSNIINETKAREVTLTEKCAELKNKLATIEAVKFIVSEEGVKSFIVKKILKVLNTKLMYYLKKFDSNCTLKFNEYFEENLVDEKGDQTTYNNFSAGERKRIDLACLFTFMDIRRLQGDVSTNISIYDELFDTSLEEKGVFMVMDVLKERVEKYGEAIYVVSHRPTAVKAATGDIIFLEKRNGLMTRALTVPSDIFI